MVERNMSSNMDCVMRTNCVSFSSCQNSWMSMCVQYLPELSEQLWQQLIQHAKLKCVPENAMQCTGCDHLLACTAWWWCVYWNLNMAEHVLYIIFKYSLTRNYSVSVVNKFCFTLYIGLYVKIRPP
jgi:hypothetical protein